MSRQKPMYKVVKEYLLSKIKTGELLPDDRVPSEKELMEMFQVSRITVRKAIDELVLEGFLYRLQGIGSFVRKKEEHEKISNLIGVFLSSASDFLSVGILRGIEQHISSLGFHAVVQFADENGSSEKEKFKRLLELNVTGFIVFPHISTPQNELVKRLVVEKRPVVFVDRTVEGLDGYSVESDNLKGAFDVTKHLIEVHGHRRMAFVTWEKSKVSSVKDRYQGASLACSERNANLTLIEVEKGRIKQLCQELKNFDAIFACTDLLAVEIMSGLQMYGVQVPRDVAVVGFDDLPFSVFVQPSLTTVRQYPERMGEKAAAILLSLLSWGELPIKKHYVPTKLIVRSSCGCGEHHHF
ncbi:GntR family transcriptional regulator [Pseudothermotoga sp.]